MARPPGITDEEVLAAARAVLLAKGVSATVEEVAERCHVGVATIFRRFPTKRALFTAAMAVTNDEEWAKFLARRAAASKGKPAVSPREELIDLAQTMLLSARKMIPLMMMRMATPPLMDKERGPARAKWILRNLTEYFQEEIEAGHVREMDPRVAARVWLGAIRHIVIVEAMGPDVDDFSTEEFIEGLADMFAVPARKPRKK